jgi:hypothetical protein
VFELSYYFSSFIPPIVLCLAAAFGVAAERLGTKWQWAVLGAASAGTLAPVAVVYRRDLLKWLANGFGPSSSYRYVAYAVIASGITAAIWRLRPRAAPLLCFAAAVAAAASFAYSTSQGTWSEMASDGETGDLYALGQSLIGYLHQHGYRDRLPYFWYDANAQRYGYGSLQSLYYYAYTYVGLTMPKIDADFRERLANFKTDRIVLLCDQRACGGAGEALRRAGLHPQREAESLLRAGSLWAWVAIYRVRSPAQPVS